jgi:hypothetical protein
LRREARVKRVILAVVFGVLVAVPVGCGLPTSDELVHSSVQSVTICSENHQRTFNRMGGKIPGIDEGTWGPEREGDCHVWYHYADSGAD